jgi:Spy/CpxP family protein refolding chaperone
MRGVYTTILTAGLMALAASPAFAQPPPGFGAGAGGFGGGFGRSAAFLIRNEKVADELKLTDDEKEAAQKAADKVNEKFRDQMDAARGDREKMADLRKTMTEESDKAVLAVLKPERAKRLKQIQVQAAGLNAFTMDDVETALKLSDKQKTAVKDATKDLQDDIRDLMQDARGDQEKMAAARKKIETMRTDAFDKVVNGLSDDQKKTWKDLTGDKFDVAALQGPGGFPGGGFPGGGFPGFGGRGQPGQVLSSFLQDQLKLTDDQKKQLTDLQKDVDSKLDKILSDDQKKQLKDMQQRGPGGFPPGGPGRPGRGRPNRGQ